MLGEEEHEGVLLDRRGVGVAFCCCCFCCACCGCGRLLVLLPEVGAAAEAEAGVSDAIEDAVEVASPFVESAATEERLRSRNSLAHGFAEFADTGITAYRALNSETSRLKAVKRGDFAFFFLPLPFFRFDPRKSFWGRDFFAFLPPKSFVGHIFNNLRPSELT